MAFETMIAQLRDGPDEGKHAVWFRSVNMGAHDLREDAQAHMRVLLRGMDDYADGGEAAAAAVAFNSQ